MFVHSVRLSHVGVEKFEKSFILKTNDEKVEYFNVNKMSNGAIHDYIEFAIRMMIPLLRIRQCLAFDDFILLLDRLFPGCLRQFRGKRRLGIFSRICRKKFFNSDLRDFIGKKSSLRERH